MRYLRRPARRGPRNNGDRPVTRPSIEHEYRNLIFDSTRWDRFTPRDGDVVVCTSYKAGTTWTQMICGLLIH